MKFEQIAIQQYTLRDFLKTREDVESTLRRVAAIGYPAVQVSGVAEGVVSEAELIALCQANKLTLHYEEASEFRRHPPPFHRVRAGRRHSPDVHFRETAG